MFNIIASILSYDVWFYFSHLALHTKYLWPYHAEHHSKEEPIFTDTYVSHALEGPFQGMGLFFPLAFLEYSYLDIALALLFVNIRGMIRHDHRLTFLFGDHHIIHHRDPRYNFGEYWLDWAVGTLKVQSTGKSLPTGCRSL